MNPRFMTPATRVLIWLCIAGAVAGLYRLFWGLGAATNLSDAHPWGIWVAFDLMCGVALAAGGYAMSAAYYIFGMKKYKPIVRPAVLTAMLGYLIAGIGITLDVGKPWALWKSIVYGQPHSVMFEVAVCITTYLTVLVLEFAPVAAEGLRWEKTLKVLTAATYPLVILGIVLSFMHQSSLGALFLLMKGRLNELWYSPILPQIFFLSSVAVGIATVSFESILTARSLHREPEHEILRGLAKGGQIALALYFFVRIGDLIWRGKLGLAFAFDLPSGLFLLEMVVGVLIPIALFAMGRSFWASLLTMAGVVVNRFDVNFFSQAGARTGYFPALGEILISLGLVSFLVLAFRYLVFRLPVVEPAGRA
ncbi:MAG TPA: Ni/Fe-hydrogenase cytochrome b subunit [Myxococcales bacterium]|nr:Ni/Fe-hydrogenase cytochrome b subunit [Myxococcales bacterium]